MIQKQEKTNLDIAGIIPPSAVVLLRHHHHHHHHHITAVSYGKQYLLSIPFHLPRISKFQIQTPTPSKASPVLPLPRRSKEKQSKTTKGKKHAIGRKERKKKRCNRLLMILIPTKQRVDRTTHPHHHSRSRSSSSPLPAKALLAQPSNPSLLHDLYKSTPVPVRHL